MWYILSDILCYTTFFSFVAKHIFLSHLRHLCTCLSDAPPLQCLMSCCYGLPLPNNADVIDWVHLPTDMCLCAVNWHADCGAYRGSLCVPLLRVLLQYDGARSVVVSCSSIRIL